MLNIQHSFLNQYDTYNNGRENQENQIGEVPENQSIKKDKASKVSKMKTSANQKSKKFSFWNSICFTCFICNKTKRNFVELISKVIYRKLSLDHILKISNNLDMLKDFILNEEELKILNELPTRNLQDHLKQMESLHLN